MGIHSEQDTMAHGAADYALDNIISFDWDDEAAETDIDDSEDIEQNETSDTQTPPAKPDTALSKKADTDEKRKAHEQAEAKRKAEWDAKQAEKKAAFAKAFTELLGMSDEDVLKNSIQRTNTDLERLTRRNMKVCVTEHIQAVCKIDPSFSRFVCYPNKNMVNCFKYINKKAEEYIRQELELLGQKAQGAVGEDVPDDLCYQWAEDYFRDLDADVDKDKDDVFVPKQFYSGATASTTKKKEPAKKKEAENSTPPEPAKESDVSQISLFGGLA